MARDRAEWAKSSPDRMYDGAPLEFWEDYRNQKAVAYAQLFIEKDAR